MIVEGTAETTIQRGGEGNCLSSIINHTMNLCIWKDEFNALYCWWLCKSYVSLKGIIYSFISEITHGISLIYIIW